MTKIFIDGEVGTTGLQIVERLKGRKEFNLLHLEEEKRKDLSARSEMLNSADVCILCLPEDASREAADLIQNDKTRVIDASIAFRTDSGWDYGFAEYASSQGSIIAKSKRVSNPGCYACASISIIHPLISAGVLPSNFPVTINAVSGYSGGGKNLISEFEDKNSNQYEKSAFYLYSLGLSHKHVPEIQKWSGLDFAPLFLPSVGCFSQGMLVSVPLQLHQLENKVTSNEIQGALEKHYLGQPFVRVQELSRMSEIERLNPEDLNGSNMLNIYVFANDASEQVVVCAQLDNLGKGASGQAVQNLNLMLGLEPTTGLL
ncbi:N-acetyl-gamma-glutamyl-phosphate reductase [Gammaproteobacteria bacterium]|nr:N-acetyl-gamma-glutamyl-phosphate reductase [Gammaproteobacteria bacterium]